VKKITFKIFVFLLNIGQLILPFRQSTLAHHVVTFKQEQKSNLSADYFVKEGIKKGKNGNYKEAIIDFSKAISIDESHSIAYYNRGLSKMSSNNYKGAITDYDKAIEIDPNYAIAYFNRGVSKFKLNDHDEAISDYSKSLEININDSDTYLNRGLVYFAIGNNKFACEDFKKAAYLGKQFAEVWLKSNEGKVCKTSK
tara:strand:+ start:941 stop:1531 length:591 start_codon:yes stop_codon:yes gene_type:complete